MVRPDALFYGASVPKIGILLGYFETHPEAATGIDPDVERELQLMIKRSSNELAAKYSQLVGLERIQRILQSERYRLYDPRYGGGLWCGKHYGIPEPRTGDPIGDYSHAATVRQCLRYYAMLERGELVSPEASRAMRRIFEAPGLELHVESFVKGLRGRDVTVVRKNGLWEDWHLDTARVQHGDRAYAIAGMAHHPRGREYLARIAAAVDAILCGPPRPKPHVHHLWSSQKAVEIEAAYDSPVIEAPHPFNEALLSFNADVPEGALLVARLRVGRTFDDSWSPYLDVVEWGSGPRDRERTREFEGGRIDVDYFRSEDRYDRAQYRFVATPSVSVRVARVDLCFSDTTGIPHSVPRPVTTFHPQTGWQRRLPVPPRSQRVEPKEIAGKICSPTSVAMVLEFRGVRKSTQEVADRVYDPIHEIYGNWPRNVEAAYTFGVPGYLTRFAEWAEVEAAIAAGQPIIASIRAEAGQLRGAPYPSTDGHLLVIVGLDAEGHVLVNDPAASTPETVPRAYSRHEMEDVWLRRGGTAYVLLPPEP